MTVCVVTEGGTWLRDKEIAGCVGNYVLCDVVEIKGDKFLNKGPRSLHEILKFFITPHNKARLGRVTRYDLSARFFKMRNRPDSQKSVAVNRFCLCGTDFFE